MIMIDAKLQKGFQKHQNQTDLDDPDRLEWFIFTFLSMQRRYTTKQKIKLGFHHCLHNRLCVEAGMLQVLIINKIL